MTESSSAISVVSDPAAAGGKALRYTNDKGPADKTVTLVAPSERVVVRARATQGGGSPSIRLLVDGVDRGTKAVSSASYADQVFDVPRLAPGSHTVVLRAVNATSNRALFADTVAFVAVETPPPPEETTTAPPPPPPPPPPEETTTAPPPPPPPPPPEETTTTPPPPPPPPADAPAQGVFPGGQFGNPLWDPQMQALKEFEALVQQPQEAVLFFHAWKNNGVNLGLPTTGLRPYAEAGYTPIITWEMRNLGAGNADPAYSYDALLRGDHDAYIRSYANQVEAFGHTVYMRPFHEMNGKWYGWGDTVNGNTPAKSAEAFRYLHRIFQEEGATNAKWLWNPNVAAPVVPASAPLADFYPGDAYVDLIGLDGYNWAGVRSTPWYSPEQVFGQSYAQVNALPSSDPIAIVETASHTAPGDKAAWINDLRATVPAKFPRVKLVMWFQSDQEGALWRVDTSQSSLDAYRALASAFTGVF
jgi:hypothetical protein